MTATARVDEQMRTSDPAIYAVGDVANALHSTLGRRLRVEHWDNAIRQGKLAAGSILGSGENYDWQPYSSPTSSTSAWNTSGMPAPPTRW